MSVGRVVISLTKAFDPVGGLIAEVCDKLTTNVQRVCLSARISQKPNVRTWRNFVYVLPTAAAWFPRLAALRHAMYSTQLNSTGNYGLVAHW